MAVLCIEGDDEEREKGVHQAAAVGIRMVYLVEVSQLSFLTNFLHRFGIVHLILQLIPVLNMFLLLCTAAGAALFASDEEDRRLEEEDVQASGQPYHDNPI